MDRIAQFEIVRTLGEGGMGIVYLARDETLQRELAVKVLKKELVGKEGRERFIREARACSRINHPNIVTVYSAGEHEGDPYMAMELLEGKTLRETIEEEGKVEWQKAAAWMTAILSALQMLHEEGIIHRDLKPDNIMVCPDGSVKLMDFGIAHVKSASRITLDVSTLGTAQYMSPEQATSMPTDARSDIFSIGTILYEMLSGENPFNAPHPMAVMYSIANEKHESLADRDLEIPEELVTVVDRVLEKEPDARYASAGEFAAELSALMSTGEGTGSAAPLPLWRRLVIPGVSLLIIAVVLAWAFYRGGNRRSAENHLRRAQQYEMENNIGGAVAEYRKAIMADPRWGLPWEKLGKLEPSEEDFDEAGRIVAIDLEKNDRAKAINHLFLAGQFAEEANMTSARAEIQKAIAADPSWEIPWNNLAIMELREGKNNIADSLLSEALEREPAYAQALYNKGSVKWDKGDLKGAEENLRAAIKSDPDFIPAYNNLGALLIEMKQPQEAASILDDGLLKFASTMYSDTLKAFLLKNRGMAASELGDDASAETWWRRALEIIPDNDEVRGLLESIGAL